MDANYLIESLMCFGLTRQEATVYLCLSQNGGMTGYEAAKQTGISRSNAYGALAGLVEKGHILRKMPQSVIMQLSQTSFAPIKYIH